MASPDIFTQINQLFRKEEVEGDLYVFLLHRFLASDPTYAVVAKELATIYDDKMVTEIWKASLPKMAKAPYFKYAAPKKPAAVNELVKKIADIEGYTLVEAEEAYQVLGRLMIPMDIFAHYGIEMPKEKAS
jgi:hypothetical protein